MDDVVRHINALAGLSPKKPVEIIITALPDPVDTADMDETPQVLHRKNCACTVLAFDYPFEFSLITGIFAGMGFSIDAGNIFTYSRSKTTPPRPNRFSRYFQFNKTAGNLTHRRRIIDQFSGTRVISTII